MQIVTFGHNIFGKRFHPNYRQFTCYMYNAVNWANNASFEFLKNVDSYATLKMCIFGKIPLILKIGLKLN